MVFRHRHFWQRRTSDWDKYLNLIPLDKKENDDIISINTSVKTCFNWIDMRAKKNTVLADTLTDLIIDGKIKQGEKLLSQNELAKKYKMSRSCVFNALNILDDRGLINRIPGKGIYVKEKSVTVKELKNVAYLFKEEQKMSTNELDNFGLEIMWGIESALRANDINFLIKKYPHFPGVIDGLGTLINGMPVDGVIVDRDYPDELIKAAEIFNIPVVVAGRKCGNPKFGYAAPNYYDYFYQTFQMLDAENYDRVCFFYSGNSVNIDEILSALRDFNTESSINYDALDFVVELKEWTDQEHLYIYSAMEKMIKEDKLPEVFICESDWTAYRIMETLKKYNIEIPGKVKLIGCLGLDIAEKSNPTISTLKVDAREIGSKSVEVLIKNNADATWPVIEKIPLKFIEGDTFKWTTK